MSTGRDKERIFFPENNRDAWVPELKRLSGLNLPAKSIADYFSCSYSTLTDNQSAMDIVRKGWVLYRITIENEIWAMATEEITPEMDSIEKNSIRTSKQKCLAMIYKVMHAEPWIPPAETERIRRLSDDDLQIELKRHLKDLSISSRNAIR